jgi:hypothetical protein
VTSNGRREVKHMSRFKRAIVAAVAAVGLAAGTMGAAAAASTFYHGRTPHHTVADSDTFYHG